MKVSGIIVEYNPFHNGHKYHIEQSKQLTNPDVLIAVCTGNYNQRGDISIINKFEKTKAALDNGVDLVVELPYIYTTQNAYVFGAKAVQILNMLKTNYLIFGSETNNLEELQKYADLQVDVTRLKQLMHDGNSYPKSYGLLSSYLYPNDMLAVTYLKALKNTNITPISIKRTNDYHSDKIEVISSASAIRKAIKDNIDISNTCPINIDNPVYNEDLYPYLRRLLMTMSSKDLSTIFLVSEGIENLLKENAIKYDNYDDFINNCVSRRYTKSRIQRICLQIMNQIKKEDVDNLNDMNYVRVLGFNTKGREYLKEIKNDCNIVTQFKNIPTKYKDIEYKTSLLYSTLFKQDYIKQELKGPLII